MEKEMENEMETLGCTITARPAAKPLCQQLTPAKPGPVRNGNGLEKL